MFSKLTKSAIAITATAFITTAAWAAPDVVKQDSAAALQADLELLAAGKNISLKAAAEGIAFHEQFAEYVENLAARYPQQISRIWLEPVPEKRAFVQFTGPVPAENPPKHVVFFGNGRITQEDHARRAELAADILKAKGMRNFLTLFDPVAGKIRIEMVLREGLPEPDAQDIFETVRDYIWLDQELFGEALVVVPSDLHLEITRGDHPIYTLETVRGGESLFDDGTFECTSGWTVEGPNGDGLITAAHCSGLNETASHDMTWRSQERDKGDVEYHTTDGTEVAEFFATSSTIRDVESTKATLWISSGNSVCVYGRSSNVRVCSHTIDAKNVTVTFTDGVTVRKLVRVNGDSSIGGDSGGGWSWNTKAWGVHSGSNGTQSFFTPIRRAERELNVDVMLAP